MSKSQELVNRQGKDNEDVYNFEDKEIPGIRPGYACDMDGDKGAGILSIVYTLIVSK